MKLLRLTLPSLKQSAGPWLCLLLLALMVPASAQGQQVSYEIALSSPDDHLVEVQMSLPAGPAERELQMPVWNALYQIRDFSQYINWLRAKDRSGKPLAVREAEKSRWIIQGAEMGAVVNYQIYVDSPGPFGAQLSSHHAFFNLAQILMYPVDGRNLPIRLHFSHVPEQWRIATPLSMRAEGAYVAENYDRLVDSPVEIGQFQEADFDELGGHFRVIVDADSSDYQMEKLTADLHKIVSAAITWMNDRPFDTYTFFYHFPHGPGGGGMEHAYSTAIEINADVNRQSTYPVNTVSAHEFFHLWNVKRIRPQSLEPVDYTRENYTRALWFSEGVTNTVEATLMLRAGLLDEKQYLYRLSQEISDLERRPAHLTQSAEQSSLDAWLEGYDYYRRPERSVSYYNKGELLGVMLDLALRESSHGQASLRELLRSMNENYARKGRFFADSDGIQEAAQAISHSDLSFFFMKYVAGTDEIPWNDFLRWVGLHAEQTANTVPDAGFTASRNFDGPMSVIAVTPGGEADRAGLQVGDTILELQGKTASQESRQDLARVHAGDSFTLKVRNHHGAERQLKWKIGAHQEVAFEIKDVEQVTPEQLAHRAAWLKGDPQGADSSRSASGATQ